MKDCGIYLIENINTGKVYVGSSINIKKRINHHYALLKRNKHHSCRLQNSWNKYGHESFVAKTLIYCDAYNLQMYEQIFIDFNQAYTKGYNSAPIAGGTYLYKHTEIAKKRMSIAATGRKLTEATKRKLSDASKGKIFTKETRDKISKAHKGKAISEKHKETLRLALKNKPLTEQHKENISKSTVGKVFSEETKKKLSIANSGKKHSAATKLKMSLSAKGKTKSPRTKEHTEKLIESRKINKLIKMTMGGLL